MIVVVTRCRLRVGVSVFRMMPQLNRRECRTVSVLLVWTLDHSGYRRYLYHQGNKQTTGGTIEAAAKPWLIPAGI